MGHIGLMSPIALGNIEQCVTSTAEISPIIQTDQRRFTGTGHLLLRFFPGFPFPGTGPLSEGRVRPPLFLRSPPGAPFAPASPLFPFLLGVPESPDLFLSEPAARFPRSCPSFPVPLLGFPDPGRPFPPEPGRPWAGIRIWCCFNRSASVRATYIFFPLGVMPA